MFNFTTLVRKALLAAVLVLGSGAALAGPTYLVTIHTQDFSGESGLLDFDFESYLDPAVASASASLWNFSGAYSDEFDRSGSASGAIPDGLVFTTGPFTNYLTQSVILGGDFSFNIRFDGSYEAIDGLLGASFGVVLYDAGLSEILAPIVRFDLTPAIGADPAAVYVTTYSDLGTVADVPEPSQLLLMLSALALAGLALRRSRRA